MSRFTDWLLNVPERRAEARARKRERDAFERRGAVRGANLSESQSTSDDVNPDAMRDQS